MVQVGSAAERGEKELKTDYPHEEGLTAGTQKQEGKASQLTIEEGSNVLSRNTELI
tara:strand:- start:362 stop:529 length:168 start_codon:yes stop_codon:yes gene_type:complete